MRMETTFITLKIEQVSLNTNSLKISIKLLPDTACIKCWLTE